MGFQNDSFNFEENYTFIMSQGAVIEREAYYEIFQAHHDRVFNFILKYTEDLERAKTLTFQVFLKIWEDRSFISTHNNISEQIYAVASDIIINEYRTKFADRKDALFLIESTKKSN